MRIFILLIFAIYANAWTFNQKHFSQLTPAQLNVLDITYLTGALTSHRLGEYLTAISVVETRAGKFDFNDNHICGHMQVSTHYTLATCKMLEDGPYLSALEAKDNFLYWLKQTNGDYDKAAQHYNAGWKLVPHSKIYLFRIHSVLKTIRASGRFK